MAKKAKSNPELTKEERIKKEYKHLLKFYKEVPKNKLDIAKALVKNAAFMKVTLDDLQAEINLEGATDEYQNGNNQYGKKTSATLQAYNQTVKSYAAVIDRLEKILPPMAEKKKSKLEMIDDE